MRKYLLILAVVVTVVDVGAVVELNKAFGDPKSSAPIVKDLNEVDTHQAYLDENYPSNENECDEW